MSQRERFQRIDEAFRAVRAAPAGKRGALLDERCAGDPALRAEVEALLAEDQVTSGPLDAADAAAPAPLPDRIGAYRIVRRLGTGGMGVVYEAEQESPRRTVALKVINLGVASRSQLRRFEYEAQILGRLQHAGIAQVFEAGTFDTGAGVQPYFAMELIRGEPITRYAETNRLGTRQRLELIARLCDALEHAHQRGVVHRDLKPGNILVDETGQPKVLDFGVARALDADIRTTTLQTNVGQLVGTVPYMSPEQASGDPGELDARSDVYALGVVAYELLAARLPYTVDGRMIHEAVRVIREDDPTPLSAVSRVFRGDVDTVIGKALAKDKARRYSSAAALAADIRRHLAERPIEARPPSAAYQLRKFARRNRTLVGGVLAVFVVLVAALVVISVLAVRQTRARAVAERQTAIAEAVNAFLIEDLLDQADPQNEADRDVTLREVLDRASARIQGAFENEPLVEAEVRVTLGRTYRNLGEYEGAEPHLRRAIELREMALGPEDQATLSARNHLGLLYNLLGRTEEAERILAETLAIRRRVFGDEDPETLDSMNNMAMWYVDLGRYDEAGPLLKRALEIRQRILTGDHQDTLVSMNNLASFYWEQGRYDEAEPLYLDVIDGRRRTLGEEHPQTIRAVGNLATVYLQQERYEEAEPLLVEVRERYRRVVGEDHMDTLIATNNLASLYARQGRHEEAASHLAAVAEGFRGALGENHWMLGAGLSNYGGCLTRLGRFEEAEAALLEGHDVLEAALGADHARTITIRERLADLYESWQRPDEVAAWEPREAADP